MAIAIVPDEELELPWPKPALRLVRGTMEEREARVYDLELEELTADGLRLAALPEDIRSAGAPGGVLRVAEEEWSPLAAPSHHRAVHTASTRVRRRRLVLGLAVGAVLVALALPSSVLGAGPAQPTAASLAGEAGHTYVVQPGDTLWGIAQRLAPKGDPRPLVDEMAAQIGSDTVAPGEHLTLP